MVAQPALVQLNVDKVKPKLVHRCIHGCWQGDEHDMT
jgi:hypothetical protein